MRIVFYSLLLLLVSSVGMAEDQRNISVTVDGEEYQCAGSGNPGNPGNNCATAVRAFEARTKNCLEHYPYTDKVGNCIKPEWKAFKEINDERCAYAASQYCVDLCMEYYPYSNKLNHCTKSVCRYDY
jgi:hypothetical protein